jgi:hypothetical protein
MVSVAANSLTLSSVHNCRFVYQHTVPCCCWTANPPVLTSICPSVRSFAPCVPACTRRRRSTTVFELSTASCAPSSSSASLGAAAPLASRNTRHPSHPSAVTAEGVMVVQQQQQPPPPQHRVLRLPGAAAVVLLPTPPSLPLPPAPPPPLLLPGKASLRMGSTRRGASMIRQRGLDRPHQRRNNSISRRRRTTIARSSRADHPLRLDYLSQATDWPQANTPSAQERSCWSCGSPRRHLISSYCKMKLSCITQHWPVLWRQCRPRWRLRPLLRQHPVAVVVSLH